VLESVLVESESSDHSREGARSKDGKGPIDTRELNSGGSTERTRLESKSKRRSVVRIVKSYWKNRTKFCIQNDR
jgi:hypothetical protein